MKQAQFINLIKRMVKEQILLEAPIDVWLKGKGKRESATVSREELDQVFNDFETFKPYFVLPDATQYTLSELKFSVSAAKFLKENGIKAEKGKPTISWFLGQIRKVKDISWQFIKEDYLPLLKSYVRNISLLKPISEYSEISELHKDIDAKQVGVYKPATESEKDIFFRSNGWSVAMPQTTEASCDLGAGTTWCTARKGEEEQNLFLSYVGRGDQDIILFYVMKDGADPKTDPWSRLSVGFINGEPAFDQGAGNISVNAANNNLTEDKFNQLLGENVAALFLKKMMEKAESVSGKHPAKKELEEIALNVNKFKQKMDSFRNEDYRLDFIENVLNTYVNTYNISPEIFHLLADDKNEDVIRMISSNRKAPPEVLNKISNITNNVYIIKNICRNPNTPEEVLKKFAVNDDKDIRHSASLNTNITPAVLEILSRDTSEKVRANVANNIKITPSIIETLSKDESVSVLMALAKNTRLSEEKLVELANHRNEFVKDAVAHNPNLPSEALRILADSEFMDIRELVAKNTNTPPDALALLAKDYTAIGKNSGFVNKAIAMNPNTPTKTLLLLAKGAEVAVRGVLFYNDKLTKEVLEVLANDEDYHISDRAIKALEKIKSRPLTESVKLYKILY